jgi:hypothetical protein
MAQNILSTVAYIERDDAFSHQELMASMGLRSAQAKKWKETVAKGGRAVFQQPTL